MKPTVYIETTIVSYLVGWLNRNHLQVAANQELTRRWWVTRRDEFELFASSVVVDEAGDGHASLAAERVRYLEGITLLRVIDSAHALQQDLLKLAKLPDKARNDALHIAVAAVHGMDYLLTWNCTHIANAVTLPRVYEVCREAGYEPPFVCTPQELMGADDVES